MTVGKEELVNRLLNSQAKNGINRTKALCLMDSLIDIMFEALTNEDKVHLKKIGTFEIVDRSPRKGVVLGKEYNTPASKGVKFIVSNVLKKEINKK